MLMALTHGISPRINACELSFRPRLTIDVARAADQHRRYCETLSGLKVQVIELAINRNYPDACFIEDTAVVLDEIAVMCSMGAASRRGEVVGVADALNRYRPTVKIEAPATLEGGDVLRLGRRLLVGLSPRTNPAGIEALAQILEPHSYRVVPVRMRECLHLKSACTALDQRTVLANPDRVEPDALAGCRIVPVDHREPEAANVLCIGDAVIMPSQYPRTATRLRELGWRIIPIDISELIKAEAGVTCCSILFAQTVERSGGS